MSDPEILKIAETIPGFMTPNELKWLAEVARSFPTSVPITWIEIGTLVGRSLYAVARSLPIGSTLISIDIEGWTRFHMGARLIHTVDRILVERADLKLVFFRQLSKDAAKFIPAWSADVVFIDGDHSHEGVTNDIKDYMPKLKTGGLLCGHDHQQGWPGVVSACQEQFKEYGVVEGTNIWFHKVDDCVA